MASSTPALVSSQTDFWMLGGLSVLLLGLVYALTPLLDPRQVSFFIPIWALNAAFIINYPHFAFSYQLFYKGFRRRLGDKSCALAQRVRLAVSGIVVPVALIGFFTFCYIYKDIELFSYGVNAMYFLVGWHYVKQGYGALITLSVYKKVFYKAWEKRILYGNGYIVWLYAWAANNTGRAPQMFYDIHYKNLDIPHSFTMIMGWLLVISSAASAIVLLRAWFVDGRTAPFNGLLAYICASYTWTYIPTQAIAFFYFIPLFHSLQYFGFVYKFKKSEATAEKAAEAQDAGKWRGIVPGLLVFAILGLLLGNGFMDWVPKDLDEYAGGLPTRGFFYAAFLLFINIHHYFLDHAFWRRDNQDVQTFLFRA